MLIVVVIFSLSLALLGGFVLRAPAAEAATDIVASAENGHLSGKTPSIASGDTVSIDPNAACALLYSNGDFVFQRGPDGDSSRGQLLKTFTDFERPSNPGQFEPPWAAMIPEDDSLYDRSGARIAYGDHVKRVIIEDRLKPTTLAQWFWHFSRLETIEGLNRLDMTDVRSMRDMFAGCAALTASPPIAVLDTSRVLDMEGMFSDCSSLTSIDVRGIEFSTVEDLSRLFAGCTALTSIDLSGLSAPSAKNMTAMFADCPNLITANLENFNAPLVTSLSSLFANDTSLNTIDIHGFSTGNAQDFSFMFMGCASLQRLDLGGFDTSAATTMRDMFNGCSSLSSVNLTGFTTARVTDMASMFTDCRALLTLDLTNFNTAKVESMYGMFMGCAALRSLNLSTFNLGKIVHNIDKTNDAWLSAYMFAGCDALARVTLGSDFVFHDGGYLPAGEWKNTATGVSYTAESVPSRVAATYIRGDGGADPNEVACINILRLYNKSTGEHLYTLSEHERNVLVALGWRYEGVAWVAPEESNAPVYRLYNLHTGDHHYTMNKAEYQLLAGVGWRQEGTCWYSDETKSAPLYRLYNPSLAVGTHLFTKDAHEYATLGKLGWRQEGVAWYGLS